MFATVAEMSSLCCYVELGRRKVWVCVCVCVRERERERERFCNGEKTDR